MELVREYERPTGEAVSCWFDRPRLEYVATIDGDEVEREPIPDFVLEQGPLAVSRYLWDQATARLTNDTETYQSIIRANLLNP